MLAITFGVAVWLLGGIAGGVAAIAWLLSGRVTVVDARAAGDDDVARASARSAAPGGASGSGRPGPTPGATRARRDR